MNGWVVLGCSVLLFAAAVMALIRIIVGPKTLDRMIGVDLLVTTIVGAIGLEAVYHRHSTTLPVLVVLTLVGFVGSVAVARFSSHEQKTLPPQQVAGKPRLSAAKFVAPKMAASRGAGAGSGAVPATAAAPAEPEKEDPQ